MERTFGVEVEFYMPVGMQAHTLAGLVSTQAGVDCRDESWNHITKTHWKIVTDRSLGDMDRGREVVTPVLQGPAGREKLARVLKALRDAGCTVSKRCGVHVHVGVGHAPMSFFQNLVRNTAYFEPVLDSLMPLSRRADANGFCKGLAHMTPAAIMGASSVDKLLNVFTKSTAYQRYHKLNLCSYGRYGTVEFRQHNGTLDTSKIENWLLLCLRMVERAFTAPLAFGVQAGPTTPTANTQTPGTKAYQLVEMMRRPQGVSGPEAIIAMGWPGGISLSQEARRMGVAVTTQRVGRVVRYYAAGSVTQVAPATPTLESMFAAFNCPAAEQGYFRARAALLSGAATDSMAA
jgi:hypothetical protein